MIVNGVAHDSLSSPTVAELLNELGVVVRGVAVAINGEIVRRSLWEATRVQPADRVEIVTAVAGG
ncbi:MAG: sulfur carrier protein ThiS [Actinomycetota bacterium]|nr:sulfur carrier protein ThiS [Actinomycetota bacterium]